MASTFDTHAAVEQFRAAGSGDAQAETFVDVISHPTGKPVTKADLEPLTTNERVRAEVAGVHNAVDSLRTDISAFEARFVRRLWVIGASIVAATFTLLKLFP